MKRDREKGGKSIISHEIAISFDYKGQWSEDGTWHKAKGNVAKCWFFESLNPFKTDSCQKFRISLIIFKNDQNLIPILTYSLRKRIS